MNLQGLWNWEMRPPWSCNYTTNINLQMNYWPALSCALPECLAPYFTFVKRLCENGKQTARLHFGCRGFTLNHNTDRWASTQPVGMIAGHTESEKDSARYSFFPLASVWVCQELWRYYEYTDDLDFLADTAFPLLREAALFCVDWLVEHDGYQVVCPSASPENAFLTPAGEEVSVAYASTMDMTLVREAFDHFEKAWMGASAVPYREVASCPALQWVRMPSPSRINVSPISPMRRHICTSSSLMATHSRCRSDTISPTGR